MCYVLGSRNAQDTGLPFTPWAGCIGSKMFSIQAPALFEVSQAAPVTAPIPPLQNPEPTHGRSYEVCVLREAPQPHVIML